jgi:hypothetical protein
MNLLPSILKMKAAGFYRTLLTTYEFAEYHNPEDHNIKFLFNEKPNISISVMS